MTRTLTTVALAAVLIACSEGDPDTGDNDDTGVVDDTGDTDGPSAAYVVAVTPSPGAVGVLIDDPIVVSFSEPMDPASVEAAWTSVALPKEDVVFSWDSSKTLLSIDASAVLEYAESLLNGPAYGYSFTIEATANDADGDEMEAAFTTDFETARRVRIDLPLVSAATGSSVGPSSSIVPLRVGDESFENRSWRAFITLDTSDLAGLVVLEQATVSVDQDSVSGEPFDELGDVWAVQIPAMSAITDPDYTATPVANIGAVSVEATLGSRVLDIASALEDSQAANDQVFSMRLQFDTAFSDDAEDDYAVFEDVVASVVFLAE